MSTNIKIIKWLSAVAAIALVMTWCVSVNIETGWIVLNSSFISNNMLLTLFGGICTGLAAVLTEKIYKYFLDKASIKNYLYSNAMMLYSDFYYMHKDIESLFSDRTLDIPENLFSSRVPVMYNRLYNVAYTEYCVFNKKDKFMSTHNNFVNFEFVKLKNWMDKNIYFQIAIIKSKMCRTVNGATQKADENIYKTIKVIDIYSKSAMEILDRYLSVLQNESSEKFNWEKNKEIIHKGYLGIYNSGNLDDFLKQEADSEIR